MAWPHRGSWFGLPDFGITERFAGNKRTAQGGSQIFGASQPQAQQNSGVLGEGTVNYGNQNVQRPNPITSGQSTGGGAPVAGPQAPTNPNDGGSNDNYFNILRANFDNARRGIESLNPQLESTYNTAKGDIENALTEATTTAETRKGELGQQFGGILKNQLQTYQDLGRQRQGTFSSLGTLDSSAFGEQQFRADQNLAEQRNATELEQTKALKSVDDQVGSFKKTAMSELARLGQEFQSGRNAIAQALAQNNIGEASAIQSALDQITERANMIQDNMRNWATQAALLKGQGIDVMGALRNINADGYASNVANQLSSARAFGNNLIPKLLGGPSGSGHIGGGRKRDDEMNGFRLG